MQEESALECLDLQMKKHTCVRWMRLRMIKVSFGCYLTFVMNSCSQSISLEMSVEGKAISKHLCDKMLYVAQINGCQKIIDIHAKHGSKEDIAKLNAVAKALKASPMKALRDFQRRRFGTPPKLLGTHYNRILHCLKKSNSAQLLN